MTHFQYSISVSPDIPHMGMGVGMGEERGRLHMPFAHIFFIPPLSFDSPKLHIAAWGAKSSAVSLMTPVSSLLSAQLQGFLAPLSGGEGAVTSL